MHTTKRPLLISIACIIGYIWVVFMFPSIFSPAIKRMGSWIPALYGLVTALTFIAFVGIWHMKRWGVELFLANTLLKVCVELIFKDEIGIAGLSLSLILLAVFIVYYKRMNKNL
ncbi:MAG: hypothetical protein J0M08_08475 [Bacteroidetes bacterium]|nr:hypothetical protein [Bacteroidota bacterium]